MGTAAPPARSLSAAARPTAGAGAGVSACFRVDVRCSARPRPRRRSYRLRRSPAPLRPVVGLRRRPRGGSGAAWPAAEPAESSRLGGFAAQQRRQPAPWPAARCTTVPLSVKSTLGGRPTTCFADPGAERAGRVALRARRGRAEPAGQQRTRGRVTSAAFSRVRTLLRRLIFVPPELADLLVACLARGGAICAGSVPRQAQRRASSLWSGA